MHRKFFDSELRLEVEALAFEQELSAREIADIMELDIDEVRAIIRRSIEDN